jgi:hypothetical protein
MFPEKLSVERLKGLFSFVFGVCCYCLYVCTVMCSYYYFFFFVRRMQNLPVAVVSHLKRVLLPLSKDRVSSRAEELKLLGEAIVALVLELPRWIGLESLLKDVLSLKQETEQGVAAKKKRKAENDNEKPETFSALEGVCTWLATVANVASEKEEKEKVPIERRERERFEYERVLRFAEESAKLTHPTLEGFDGECVFVLLSLLWFLVLSFWFVCAFVDYRYI